MPHVGSINDAELENQQAQRPVVLPTSIVVLGASAGGPPALMQIAHGLPEFFSGAVLIAQHMRPGFTKILAQMLSSHSDLVVREAENHSPIYRGSVFVMPGGAIGTVERREQSEGHSLVVRLADHQHDNSKGAGVIDAAMISAAQVYGDRAIGVLLSGIGADGREGMRAIKEARGHTIAQEESTCTLSDAPRTVAELGLADDVLPLWDIAERVVELVGE